MVDPNLDQNIRNFVFGIAKELDLTLGEGVDDSDLIAIIRNCPIIYDRNLPDYRSDVKKGYFWNAIAEVFGVEKDIVTNRWINLRCYYGRHRSNPEKHHIAELSFLDPFVLPRNRLSTPELDSPGILSLLIESVKKRPELYTKRTLVDLQSGVDMNTKIKNAWLEVASETGLTVDHCQKKWHYLREMYARTKKQLDKGVEKRFHYFEELSFLKDHIIQRSRHGRIGCKRKSENIGTVPDILYFNSKPAVKTEFVDTSNGQMEDQQDTNESFMLSESDDDSSNDMQTSVQEDNSFASKSNSSKDSARPTPQSAEDEDDKFGRAIAADLKNIPFSKKKLKLKANIYKLICEAIDDDDS